MLPPHELKNKNFSHALRGYSTAEVDDYIEFLLDRYADVYRRNDQLEKELRMAMVKLEELTEKEDAINRALVNAQRIEEKLIREANEKADIITRAAKTNADKILNDFHRKISKERVVLHQLRTMVSEFKSYVLSSYDEHIEAIRLLSPPLDSEPEWETDPEEYTDKVLTGIRDAANQAAQTNENKQRLEKILESHTDDGENITGTVKTQMVRKQPVAEESAASGGNEEVKNVVPVETPASESVPNGETKNEEASGEKIDPIPLITGVKRRPRPRRTIESTSAPKKQPIPPSPGEGDTEEALDRLFSEPKR